MLHALSIGFNSSLFKLYITLSLGNALTIKYAIALELVFANEHAHAAALSLTIG